MRSVNKIRERDLDPRFLLSLMNNVQGIDVSELLNDYIRKDEMLPRASLPEDYVDEVEDSIESLQEHISEIENTYRQIEEPIVMEDLDSELQDILTAIFYFLQHVKTQDDEVPLITYSDDGERIIIVKDDEGNEYNVVIPLMYDNDSDDGFNAIDKARFESQISTLQNQITSLSGTVQVLQKRVDNLRNDGSSAGLETLEFDNIDNDTIRQLLETLVAQESRIKLLEDTLKEIKGNSSEISLTTINSRVQQCENDIMSLNSKTAQRVQYSSLNIELQQKFNDIVDIKNKVDLMETNKMSKPALEQDGYLYYSAKAGNIVKSREPLLKAAVCKSVEEIVIAQNNNENFIINLQTGEGYQFNKVTKAYDLVQVEKNPEYNYMLVLNTQTEIIEYLILDGTIVKLSVKNSTDIVNSFNLTVKKVNISAGSNYRIDRVNNLQKMPPTILIYDLETDSRTIGTYINNEGVITVSNDADGFTLYNDSNYGLEVLIMVGD